VTGPSKFAPEFKARAIDLYRSSEGRTIADVARELGIGTETFRKWVRQDEAGMRPVQWCGSHCKGQCC
jgi:transposase